MEEIALEELGKEFAETRIELEMDSEESTTKVLNNSEQMVLDSPKTDFETEQLNEMNKKDPLPLGDSHITINAPQKSKNGTHKSIRKRLSAKASYLEKERAVHQSFLMCTGRKKN